jgi:hypothetical protein
MRAPAPTDASSSLLRRVLALAAIAAVLTGCDLTGEAALEKAAAQREADGKAVGSACRHAGRAIEDCYVLNAKAPRSAVFAGWREMDEYMRENKLEALAPSLTQPGAKSEKADKSAKSAKAELADKRADAAPAKVDLPPKPRLGKPESS